MKNKIFQLFGRTESYFVYFLEKLAFFFIFILSTISFFTIFIFLNTYNIDVIFKALPFFGCILLLILVEWCCLNLPENKIFHLFVRIDAYIVGFLEKLARSVSFISILTLFILLNIYPIDVIFEGVSLVPLLVYILLVKWF